MALSLGSALALAGGNLGASAAGNRGLLPATKTANAQKHMQQEQFNFMREMRDYTSQQYADHGVPFIPGLTTGGGAAGSPLPKHTQVLGNRSVTTSIPGLRPQAGAPTSGVSGAMGMPLLR